MLTGLLIGFILYWFFNKTNKNVAAQRLQAATALAGIGQGGLGQAVSAAGTQVSAAMTPQDLYNKYASVIFGTPSASYTPNFAGTQGTTSTGSNMGISLQGMFGK